ncbi:MAG TPA: hypothetical protein VFR41_14865 [Acidimicrobiia bacterium]|nr:hypothetical protein [Acidimicrobiia bacterium]
MADEHHHDIDNGRKVTMATLSFLGAEAIKHPNLWNPTMIGILTVLCAVGLFCGSVYLLLSTNLGARLGFLVAAAGLTGFMVLLTTLWLTTSGSPTGNSDLDPPHGNSPTWKVLEVVDTPAAAQRTAVQNIATSGTKITSQECKVDTPPPQCSLIVQAKPAIDAALVTAATVAGQEPPNQPLAQFGSSTDYLIDFDGYQSYEMGGGTKNFFWHNPKYAAIQFCQSKPNVTPPTCDPLQNTQYVILERNLGSIREPVVAYWIASLILFAAAVLGLHWWEQDERARRKAAATLAPVPTPGA